MNAAGIITAAVTAGQESLNEFEAKRVLSAYGVPVCREALVGDAAAAARAAAEIGYPVVVKACGAGLNHKTEAGLVKTGLADAAAVGDAAGRLAAKAPAGSGILVQEMVHGRRELMLGMKRDPQFGACVSFGLGGIFAEALADTTLALAPVSEADAADMLDRIRARGVLGPWRGMEAVDRDILVGAIVGLSRMALDHPAIVEIDVNPLVVAAGRPVAVDALVVLGG